MKNKKLTLSELKINSFVTKMDDKQSKTVKGEIFWEVILHLMLDAEPASEGPTELPMDCPTACYC